MFGNANVNAAPMANMPHHPTYMAPAYGYGCTPHYNDDFVLIVVLFILLIIVGACGYSFCK